MDRLFSKQAQPYIFAVFLVLCFVNAAALTNGWY